MRALGLGTVSLVVMLVVGALLLVLGRKLFWFFVGAIGFIAGMYFGTMIIGGANDNTVLLIAIACGVLGIFAGLFLQKIAITVGGAMGGGFIAMNAGSAWLGLTGNAPWIAFGVGALIGAILLHSLFDWALIILSSLAGAALIGQALHFHNSPILVAAVAFVGVLIQARMKRDRKEKET